MCAFFKRTIYIIRGLLQGMQKSIDVTLSHVGKQAHIGAIFKPSNIAAVMGLTPSETQDRLSRKGFMRSGIRTMRVLDTGNGCAKIDVRGDIPMHGVVMGVRLSKD